MLRFILSLSVASVLNISLHFLEGQCIEGRKEELVAGKSQDKKADQELQALSLAIKEKTEWGGNDHQLLPRSYGGPPGRCPPTPRQRSSSSIQNAVQQFNFGHIAQIPGAIRAIFSKFARSNQPKQPSVDSNVQEARPPSRAGLCTPETRDRPNTVVFRDVYQECRTYSRASGQLLTERDFTKCIIHTALEAAPYDPNFKLVSDAVIDLLKKDVPGFYSADSVLEAAGHCRTALQRPQEEIGEATPAFFSKCFSDSLLEMHPLKTYAPAAFKKKLNGFFDRIAKSCYEKMPKELNNRREVSRYYLKCLIDTSSEDYKDHLVVQCGRRWLDPYINRPDEVFNRETVLETAENCEEKTKRKGPGLKEAAVFFCFFRFLLSLHPRTQQLAGYLTLWSLLQPSVATGDFRPPTQIGPFTGALFGGLSRSVSSLDFNKQKELIECMVKAVLSVPIASLAGTSASGWLSKIPMVGGLIQNQDLTPKNIVDIFIDAVAPCFKFFRRDHTGQLQFDQNYGMAETLQAARSSSPTTGLAIDAAEVVANNIKVVDEEGKTQFKFDLKKLAGDLGVAAYKSDSVGVLVTKLITQ